MPKMKRLTCAQCPGKKFNTQSALTMHYNAVHKNKSNGAATHAITPPKKRGFFGWLFGRKKTEQPNVKR